MFFFSFLAAKPRNFQKQKKYDAWKDIYQEGNLKAKKEKNRVVVEVPIPYPTGEDK